MPKHIGIILHSAEGALLCFRTAVLEGIARMGDHAHPKITMSGRAMADSMPAWEAGDYDAVRRIFAEDCRTLARAGADFALLPDNTAHIALEQKGDELPLPLLHIAEVVAEAAADRGYAKVGILGTRWTMEGPVYPAAFARRKIGCCTVDAPIREQLHAFIFNELCLGVRSDAACAAFVEAADSLREAGCDAVAAVCTEIPLILTNANSPLPVLDSTRLLARAGVAVALGDRPMPDWRGGPIAYG